MKRRYFIVLAAVMMSVYLSGQVGDTITLAAGCSYLGEPLPRGVTLFASNSEAESAIKRIVDASGLTANFDVQAAGVPNAMATIRGERRLILYNPFFMTEMEQKAHNKWAALAVLAHEIGHHLNGHTLTRTGSSPKIELEADVYSGFILQRIGASLLEAKSALEALQEPPLQPGEQRTHPPKNDRLAAVGSGWSKACDADSKCSTGSVPRPNPAPEPGPTTRRPEPEIKPGPNSCEYANDDECDEPVLCDRGTDTNDCRVRTTRQRDTQRPASVCSTIYGTCPMIQAIPPGTTCTCFTAFGPIVGVAR